MPGTSPVLSFVVPMRNEVESLPELVRELERQCGALGRVGVACEVILVDDGSDDGSIECALDLSTKLDALRVLALDRQEGQSSALAAGFRAARGDVIVTLDADLQNDPADVPKLLGALAAGADVANGVRTRRRDHRWRRLSSRVANAVRNAAIGHSASDIGCSLRAMRAPFLRRVKPFRGYHRFLPALLAIEGARLVELPVAHRPRRHGRSNYGTLGRALAGGADLIAVMWMRRRALRARTQELERPGAE